MTAWTIHACDPTPSTQWALRDAVDVRVLLRFLGESAAVEGCVTLTVDPDTGAYGGVVGHPDLWVGQALMTHIASHGMNHDEMSRLTDDIERAALAVMP